MQFQLLKKSKILQAIHRLAMEQRGEIYLVGGAVRDFLLERSLGKDFDFVLPGNAADLSKEFSQEMGGKAFLLDDVFGTWRVVIRLKGEKTAVDFCSMQGGDIFADLRQRDFTVNSLAIRLPDIFRNEKPFTRLLAKGLKSNPFPYSPFAGGIGSFMYS